MADNKIYDTQFSLVWLQYLWFMQSYNKNYGGCTHGVTHSNCEETSQFSASQRTDRVSVMPS